MKELDHLRRELVQRKASLFQKLKKVNRPTPEMAKEFINLRREINDYINKVNRCEP